MKLVSKAPIGICGTGVIEITAELMRAGLIDETGLLDESYARGISSCRRCPWKRYCIYPKEYSGGTTCKVGHSIRHRNTVREIQVDAGKIHKVYLSGDLVRRSMLKGHGYWSTSSEVPWKTEAIGNSSLAGAANILLMPV